MAEANDNRFLYKPQSERGTLAVLLPANMSEQSSVTLVDAEGNELATGNYSSRSNGNRATYRFDKPGNQYGNDISVMVTDPDGESYTIPVGSGATRYIGEGLDPNNISADPRGAGNIGQGAIGDPANYETQLTYGGEYPSYRPGYTDPTSLGTPYVDYPGLVQGAYGMGGVNQDIYYGNLLSPMSQAAALSATATDIAGIQMGAEALSPMVRGQGRLDTAENIARAGAIDEFNLQRYPEFNRQAQEQKEQAAQATGMDYQRRMSDLLDSLESQSRGEMPAGLEDAFNRYQTGRGADLATASGISSLSRAGIRAQDRLNVMERLGLIKQAEAQIPGVATTAQQVLEAPTQYAQPTQVPFIASNISQRLPVQPNISAGATQLQVGTRATDLSTISPTALLQMGLSAEQWNQMQDFERDKFILGWQQDYINRVDAATMADIGTEYGIEQYQDAINRYEDERNWNQVMQAIQAGGNLYSRFNKPGTTQTTGTTDTTGTTGTTGQQGVSGSAADYAASTDYQLSESRAGEFDAGAQEQPTTATQPTGAQQDYTFSTEMDYSTASGDTGAKRAALKTYSDQTGGATQTEQSLSSIMKSSKGNSGSSQVIGQAVDGANVAVAAWNNLPQTLDTVSQWLAQDGQQYYRFGDTEVSSQAISNYMSDLGNTLWYGGDPNKTPPTEYRGQSVVGTEYKTDGNVYTLENGETVTSSQMDAYRQEQANAPSAYQRATQAINDYNLDWQTLGNTATAIANWDRMSTSERLGATGNISTSILTNAGLLNQEQATRVNRSVGNLGILLDNNSTDIQRGSAIASLMATPFTDNPNLYASLNAISVLGSNASNEDKVASLTAIGIDAAQANNIISQTTAGNMMAGLSIINTARNWDDMDDVQRAVAVMNTGGQTLQAINSFMASGAQTAAQASAASTGATVATTGTATATTGATVGSAGASVGTGTAGAGAGSTTGTATTGAGSSSLGTAASVLAGAATYAGASYTAYNAWRTSKDTPRSQSGVSTIASMGAAGASVGGYHGGGYGALIGLGAGIQAGIAMEFHGTGKGKGQWLRDSWRDSMETQRMVTLDGNKHNVTLADGTAYDIGVDGDAKLENTDGTLRHSFDIDWSNDAATSSIPSAHLAALATGLDPNRSGDQDLWHRGTAQLLNAASSNAGDKAGIQQNLRSIMDQAGVTADTLVRRIESLRLENNIDDQEYGVYINSVNEMYGTGYTPSDREEARAAVIAQIEAIPENERTSDIKEFYETITNDRKLALNQRNTNKRKGKETKDTWEIAGYQSRKEVPTGMSNWEMEQVIERNAQMPTTADYKEKIESSPIMSTWYNTEDYERATG